MESHAKSTSNAFVRTEEEFDLRGTFGTLCQRLSVFGGVPTIGSVAPVARALLAALSLSAAINMR